MSWRVRVALVLAWALVGVGLALVVAGAAGAESRDGAAVVDEVIVYRAEVAKGYGPVVTRAVEAWENVDGRSGRGWGVKWIKAGNTSRKTTLVIRTICENSGVLGRFKDYADPDVIEINRCALANDSERKKRKVAVHEAGHAVDLHHPSVTEYHRLNAVMYSGPDALLFQRPREHDRREYRDRWGG